ncbi:MAG: hypothetical protein BWY67_02177 [Bacteroidetes bacterium ADurb.Bin397]|nr:MAG: hypothetical protein BWY67_02177 [Bacteroidetes bacterium ADurb.Bin397]
MKQTDFNGLYQYSGWSVVSFDAPQMLAAYPNPSNGNFTVQLPFENLETGITLRISNSLGAIVFERKITSQLHTVNLTDVEFANGIYTISAMNLQEVHHLKIKLFR